MDLLKNVYQKFSLNESSIQVIIFKVIFKTSFVNYSLFPKHNLKFDDWC